MASPSRRKSSAAWFASLAANVVRPDQRPDGFVALGTLTQWGTVRSVVAEADGGRTYMCIDQLGTVAVVPSDMMEHSRTFGRKRRKKVL